MAPELDLSDVAPDGYRSVVLDAAGEPILDLVGSQSNRVYVTLDEIPLDLQNAFVAIEDERFYEHPGIDLHGIARWNDPELIFFRQFAVSRFELVIHNLLISNRRGETR